MFGLPPAPRRPAGPGEITGVNHLPGSEPSLFSPSGWIGSAGFGYAPHGLPWAMTVWGPQPAGAHHKAWFVRLCTLSLSNDICTSSSSTTQENRRSPIFGILNPFHCLHVRIGLSARHFNSGSPQQVQSTNRTGQRSGRVWPATRSPATRRSRGDHRGQPPPGIRTLSIFPQRLDRLRWVRLCTTRSSLGNDSLGSPASWGPSQSLVRSTLHVAPLSLGTRSVHHRQ